MKQALIIISLIIASLDISGQDNKLISFDTILISSDSLAKVKSYYNGINSAFFEDDSYLVRSTCSGEWGGTIWFKNKKTGIEYSCSATCPVVVNKINGKYIVTCTLAHLSGSTEILEIENPDSMSIFRLPEPRQKKGKKLLRYVGDDESKSTIGAKKILDCVGVQTLASFPIDGKLYHVITNFHETFLSTIENQEFTTIDTLLKRSIWTYGPRVIKTPDNHYVVFFSNSKTNGYLDIIEDKIKIIESK